MPVVTKPATATALVAHRVVEVLVEADAMPEGALSLVCGSAGDLLDRLDGQDVLAFTGSSATAEHLRAGRAVTRASTHVNVEADSLNAAVLGADVAEGELLDLFVGDIVRDVTQKTGQKCTAIRRVYVPEAMLDVVVQRLHERLTAIRVGDPSREDVGLGPVATAQQLRNVRDGIARLASVGRVVCGGADGVDGVGVAAGKGYFVAPTLRRRHRSSAGRPSPTRTRSLDRRRPSCPSTGPPRLPRAAREAGAGEAWCAASTATTGAGCTSSSRASRRSTAVFASPRRRRRRSRCRPAWSCRSLLHGGPGRAGGGEELGGRRGLSLYLQRVALQGDRAIVESIARGL